MNEIRGAENAPLFLHKIPVNLANSPKFSKLLDKLTFCFYFNVSAYIAFTKLLRTISTLVDFFCHRNVSAYILTK